MGQVLHRKAISSRGRSLLFINQGSIVKHNSSGYSERNKLYSSLNITRNLEVLRYTDYVPFNPPGFSLSITPSPPRTSKLLEQKRSFQNRFFLLEKKNVESLHNIDEKCTKSLLASHPNVKVNCSRPKSLTF